MRSRRKRCSRIRGRRDTYISTRFRLLDESGEPYAVCGVSTDITERIRAERQIKESKEQLRTIIETAHDAFVSIDERGVITGWNTQAESTFGWSRGEAIGRPIHDLHHSAPLSRGAPERARALPAHR